MIGLDQEAQNVRLTIEGDPLDYDAVKATIDRLGGSIHSVDQASYGSRIVDEPNHADFG